MRSPTLVCCLLLAAASPAAAQNWTYARSDHFEVYTTGGDGRAREALTYFERIHAFFVDVMKASPRTTTPTRLIVFSGDRQFAPYSPSAAAAAFYASGPDRDFIVMARLDDESYPIVVHEYAHLIMRHSGHEYPLWLNEGLAEFFSTVKPDGNKMAVGQASFDRLAYLTQGVALMDLDRLFAVTHDSPEYNARAHAGVFYSQSWALTHMIHADNRYRKEAGRFVDLVGTGTPSAVALQQVYGRSLEEVGRDLNSYIRRENYQYYEVDYKSPETSSRVPTRQVDTFEAGLVTANLLANLRDREDDARKAFEQLAAERPDDLALVESRAVFERRSGRTEEALPFMLRAAELGSTTASIYRDLAVLEPNRAEEFLAKAVELNPDDLDVRLYYASLIARDDRYGQALGILSSVTRVPRESAFEFFQLMANVYARLNEIDRARTAALRAAEHAKPGEEADYATRLIKSIDDYAAARAAAAERQARLAAAREAAPQEARDAAPAAPANPPAADPSSAALPPRPATPFPTDRVQDDPLVVTVAGRLQNVVCGANNSLVFEIATANGTLRLRVEDPLAIRVVGKDEATIEMNCGVQKEAAPVRVGYIPVIDAGANTVGNVRVLDYR